MVADGTVEVGEGYSLTLTGDVTGSGEMVKTGAGELTLSGDRSKVQRFLGGWQDILQAGVSSFLLAPTEFFQLAAAGQFCVPYRDLLL